MDSIGGMLNAQNTLQKGILKWFYWEKLMVYNGILMETLEFHVMVSIGLIRHSEFKGLLISRQVKQ